MPIKSPVPSPEMDPNTGNALRVDAAKNTAAKPPINKKPAKTNKTIEINLPHLADSSNALLDS